MRVELTSSSATAAVLGAGTMGAQIAYSLALGGMPVSLWARRASSFEGAAARIADAAAFMVEVGLASKENATAALERISYVEDLAACVSSADFILEAVAEDLELKSRLLSEAESAAHEDAILASTTSAISASKLQALLRRPERFVVAHYAQPAHLIKLVEVVPGALTEPAVVETLVGLLAGMGKSPVKCPDIPGFLWARIQFCILREFSNLVERGLTTPEACDAILKEGYAVRLPAMGSFEHADLAGLDLVGSEAAGEVWADLCNQTSPDSTIIGEKRRRGELGMRSGRGFYDWTKRDPDAFRRNRDEEIVRRTLIQAGGKVLPPD